MHTLQSLLLRLLDVDGGRGNKTVVEVIKSLRDPERTWPAEIDPGDLADLLEALLAVGIINRSD